jgi:hypothetical protein
MKLAAMTQTLVRNLYQIPVFQFNWTIHDFPSAILADRKLSSTYNAGGYPWTLVITNVSEDIQHPDIYSFSIESNANVGTIFALSVVNSRGDKLNILKKCKKLLKL